MGMRNVPEWARVDKAEYRRLREELRKTSDASSFAFVSVWNLMIEDMEDRYQLHLQGRHRELPTLEWAVTTMQKEMVDERARLMEQQHTESVEFIDGQPTGSVEPVETSA